MNIQHVFFLKESSLEIGRHFSSVMRLVITADQEDASITVKVKKGLAGGEVLRTFGGFVRKLRLASSKLIQM